MAASAIFALMQVAAFRGDKFIIFILFQGLKNVFAISKGEFAQPTVHGRKAGSYGVGILWLSC
jgi:hypothetical protein